jgi:hypothetical protein
VAGEAVALVVAKEETMSKFPYFIF